MEILERLLSRLREVCAWFPDERLARARNYSMVDVGLGAFSMFFMQSESFLEYQRQMEQGHSGSNCQTLFGMQKIPTDNHIRMLLDAVEPKLLQPCFDQVLEEMRRADGLKRFQRLGGRILIALDGTEYFCSQKWSCPQCLRRKRSNGVEENYHAMLAANIVAPGHNMVLPLMPEQIANRDGSVKQDCERNAARRWLQTHGEKVSCLRPVYLGDSLFSCQPMAAAVLAEGGDFLFVSKPDGHKTLYEYLDPSAMERRTVVEAGPPARRHTYRYCWMNDVPLRDGDDALRVNWLQVVIEDSHGKTTYRCDFVTSLAVNEDNIAEIAACGRARWKIENESFNVLKNNGYNLEHNFGHGKKHLASLFVTMNLLAFAMHTVCDCLEPLWCHARERIAKRVRFFRDLYTITTYVLFQNWLALINALALGRASPT